MTRDNPGNRLPLQSRCIAQMPGDYHIIGTMNLAPCNEVADRKIAANRGGTTGPTPLVPSQEGDDGVFRLSGHPRSDAWLAPTGTRQRVCRWRFTPMLTINDRHKTGHYQNRDTSPTIAKRSDKPCA